MSLRWRWSLVIVLAAVVTGGLFPQTFLQGSLSTVSTASAATNALTQAELHTGLTFGCNGASCGRSAPTPAAPVLAVAGAVAAAALAVGTVASFWSRRSKRYRLELPRGMVATLLRPPQLSL